MLVESLVDELAEKLIERSLTLVTAESCTGGWVGQSLTGLSGSSRWFAGGVISYSDSLKHNLLGVRLETLVTYGAVSKPVACAMATGAIEHLGGDVALAVTGIAGPSGAVASKPVGTVWIAFASMVTVSAKYFQFSGNREAIRYQSVVAALEGMLDFVREHETL
ncbi:MAG: CinA family protein [Endozoicomonas sp. (ex Botrylloides leachii)]|nr:CinA family protein [Endozoicomonas sp. (ex Botrylloides leachii)]